MSRTASRNPTEAAVACQPYASSAANRALEGVMRNYSSQGSYIETVHDFLLGTILIVRVVRYMFVPGSLVGETQPRPICLAEVKWRQELADGHIVRYCMGLKYID